MRVPGEGKGVGRKAFFSGEKKQKTFAKSGVYAARESRDSIKEKFFGSFFQKRTASFPRLAASSVAITMLIVRVPPQGAKLQP
jgi:hypothetical protein